MKQNRINILEGSLFKNILFFAIPLILIGILEQLFNAADVAVVGKFTGDKGTNAMAAVGANSPMIGLFVYTFIAMSLGINVVVAQAKGASNDELIKSGIHTSVVFSLLIGILLTIICLVFANPIYKAQKIEDPEVFSMTVKYFKIYAIGIPLIILYNFLASIYRGVGNTRTPLIVLAIAGVLNLCLNFLFVLGFNLDVEGVAWATVISNAVAAIILFILLLKAKDSTKIYFKDLKINFSVLKKILKIGVPAGLQSAVFCIANIIIQTKINSLGNTIMAASSVALNIEGIISYFFAGFSQACTTFVGQNFGAGYIKRCKQSMIVSLIEGLISLAIMDLIMVFLGKYIISIFNDDKDVIKYAYMRLLFMCVAYTFTLMYEVFSGYMRGFGISLMPSILTVVGICGVRLLWIAFYYPHHETFKAILIAYPLSLGATAILMFIWTLITHPAKKNMPLLNNSDIMDTRDE